MMCEQEMELWIELEMEVAKAVPKLLPQKSLLIYKREYDAFDIKILRNSKEQE